MMTEHIIAPSDDPAAREEPAKTRLVPIATKSLTMNEELYKVVDFLNKTLRERRLMFGLTQNSKEKTMTISVYEV